MSNEVTAYTGTFTTMKGSRRTMTFVRNDDIPVTLRGGGTKNLREGLETVYDINAKQFRTFNWKTSIGEVSAKNINYSFDV
tara:strand:- start:67 stop:309 length:243 start_codon:yes stop_codon:yes gene_type:complete